MAGPRLSAQVGETPLSLTMSQIAEKTGVEGGRGDCVKPPLRAAQMT